MFSFAIPIDSAYWALSLKNAKDLGRHIFILRINLHSLRRALHVHQNHRHFFLSRQNGHPRIGKSRNIIED